MYINKSIPSGFGIDVTCHKISAIYTYFNPDMMHVSLAGYISKEAKEANGSSLVTNQVEVPMNFDLSLEDVYTLVLEKQPFIGGVLTSD